MRTVISLAAALAMAAAPAMIPRPQDPGDRPMDDRLFAQAAAASGLAEISLSRIAVQEGQDGEVKNYAAEMVEDHTRTSQRLTELAAAKGIALPTEIGIQDQATAVALSGGPGLAFDRGYLQQQVAAAHRRRRPVQGRGRARPGPRAPRVRPRDPADPDRALPDGPRAGRQPGRHRRLVRPVGPARPALMGRRAIVATRLRGPAGRARGHRPPLVPPPPCWCDRKITGARPRVRPARPAGL